MGNKAKKTSLFHSAMPRAQLIAAVFFGTITIALMSFISMALGMLGLLIFSVALVSYNEVQRRKSWERAAKAKSKRTDDTIEDTDYRVEQNSNAIADLQREVVGLKKKISAQERKAAPSTSAKPLTSTKARIETVTRKVPYYEPIPKAIHPKATSPARPNRPAPPPKTAKRTDTNYNADDYDFVSDDVVKELLRHAVDKKRVEVFFQPIVRLPQRQTRFYELYARIRAKPGLYLPAARYMGVAEQDNMDTRIDDILLMHSLQTIEKSAHIEKAAPFFINITNTTLRNGAFMKRLIAFLSKNRDLAPRLVFEIEHATFAYLQPSMLEIIRGLGRLGCSFSLDHVENVSQDFDIAELMKFKVRFIKIKAETLIKSDKALLRTKRMLEANGIGVIIEHIETEEHMRDLIDYDVHYGQGYLFGKPELEGAYKSTQRIRRAAASQSE